MLSLLAGSGASAYHTRKQADRFEASAMVVVGPSDRVENYKVVIPSLDTVSRRELFVFLINL
jgi:hypothetical protein